MGRRQDKGDKRRHNAGQYQGANAEILSNDDLARAKASIGEEAHEYKDIVDVGRSEEHHSESHDTYNIHTTPSPRLSADCGVQRGNQFREERPGLAIHQKIYAVEQSPTDLPYH